jgi:mRNA interferase MazF
VSNSYVPEAGDVVWMQFDPQAGHEQMGKRPALVISPSRYNAKVGLMLCCPITSKSKGYIFEVGIETDRVSGVIMTDQIRSFDWKERGAVKAGEVPADDLVATKMKLKALLEIE